MFARFVNSLVEFFLRTELRSVSLCVTLVVTTCSAACASERFEYSEVAMGGRARIALYAADEASAQNAAREAFARIAYLEDVMSDYRQTSEVSRLCASPAGEPVKVSPEMLFILSKSRELARRSGGAFDVTVGPVVQLWRSARKSGVLPAGEQIAAAKNLVGWQKIALDADAGTVTLRASGMRLDFGGIAKGYACDEAMRVLKQSGIKSALVEMGGDMVVSSPPPGTKGWEIKISGQPSASTVHRSPFTVHRLADCAISSSGDTEQFVEIGGVRYSHIVDPHTGLGLTNRIAVTVIAPNGVTSDGLSTAISVLGERKGRTLASTFPGVSVYIRTASH